MMRFPYSQVHVSNGIIFAANSGRIESFKLQDGSYLSTWTHPGTENFIESVKSMRIEDAPSQSVEAAEEPPSKRQKTSEGEAISTSSAPEKSEGTTQNLGVKKKPLKKMQRADRPLIIQITSTEDGKHVVAVSGHDKTIWTFEHDGAGRLKQLSKRSVSSGIHPSKLKTYF